MKQRKYNHPDYISIPYFIIQDEKLDYISKFLFALFWSFSLSGNSTNASNGYLATLLKLDESCIGKHIKYLEDIGYIKRTLIKNQRYIDVLYIPVKPVLNQEEPKNIELIHKGTPVGGSSQRVLRSEDQGYSGGSMQGTPVGVLDNKEDIKEDNKEKDTPKKIAPAKAESLDKTFLLTLEDMIKDNPYGIAAQMLAEWLVIRKRKKAPLTHCAWNRTNKVLTRLVNNGLDASDCFERMVANGWQGMEYKYFEQELKSTTVASKIDLEREIRARELKAQEQKRQEMEESKGGINKLIQMTSCSEQLKLAEDERIQLGMTVLEHHNYRQKIYKEKINAA